MYTVSSEVDTSPFDVRRTSKNKNKKLKTKYVSSDSSEYDSKILDKTYQCKSKNKSKKHKTKYVCSDSSEYDSKLVR